LAVEWDGTLAPPDEHFEIEQLYSNSSGGLGQWMPFFRSVTLRSGAVYRHVFINVGEPSPSNRLTIRICNVNRFGRSCTLANSAYKSIAAQTGPGKIKGDHIGPPWVQNVTPATYTKTFGQSPSSVDIRLQFSGAAPDRARYNIDDGLRMAWYEATKLSVNGNIAVVNIPYDPFRQASHQVHIKLSNAWGESIGTIQVLTGYAAGPPPQAGALSQSLNPGTTQQKTTSTPATAPLITPKNIGK
jgi:hypothetical protein